MSKRYQHCICSAETIVKGIKRNFLKSYPIYLLIWMHQIINFVYELRNCYLRLKALMHYRFKHTNSTAFISVYY